MLIPLLISSGSECPNSFQSTSSEVHANCCYRWRWNVLHKRKHNSVGHLFASQGPRVKQFMDIFSIPEMTLLAVANHYFISNRIEYDPVHLFKDVSVSTLTDSHGVRRWFCLFFFLFLAPCLVSHEKRTVKLYFFFIAGILFQTSIAWMFFAVTKFDDHAIMHRLLLLWLLPITLFCVGA